MRGHIMSNDTSLRARFAAPAKAGAKAMERT
jgi:hypothetical protein